MTCEFNGRILYANGQPAANVQVRVLDKDAPGKIDDDLTVTEGVSDSNGKFTVVFNPAMFMDKRSFPKLPFNLPFPWSADSPTIRFPDPTDIYLPYLQFSYTVNERARTHKAFMRPLKKEYRLPETPPVKFRPSLHGWKFLNRFKGYFIPFSIPSLPDIPGVGNVYGMCGGMTAAALDMLLAGRVISKNDKTPKRKTPLHRYLYRRQIDSFGSFGEQIVRFARWMFLPDGTTLGTWRKSLIEFETIRAKLDDDNPLPIGLVYVSSQDTLKIWENHQVLAWQYVKNNETEIDLYVYDPNYPERDDVVIRCRHTPIQDGDGVTLFGLNSTQWVGSRQVRPVRGFFAMPYTPVTPPDDISE
ncbi:MAG: hypothetical protein JXA42_07330 [Anaerolineales bacterium]|nr:hypothetical protein [Anaerolineales bacterium]